MHSTMKKIMIYSVYSHGNDSNWIKPCVNGNVIPMELDTGSSVSVISEADYVKYFKGEKLFALIPLTQPISSLKTSSRRADMSFRVISHLDSSLAMVNEGN
jgi:hypothetical protein